MNLIDTRELSAMTQIPERTFDQYAYLGSGPAYIKIGRHRRYKMEDVEAWLESKRRGGSTT